MALFLRELFRRLHLHGGEEVAAAMPRDIRHPLAANSKRRARLCPFVNLDGFHAMECGHLDSPAERQRGEVHWNLTEQVEALAAEEFVFLHVHDDVKMSGRSSGAARFSLALQPELL